MPFISTQRVKEIRQELKTKFPKVKFSVTGGGSSGVTVAIMQSPYVWAKNYEQLNTFYPERSDHPEFVGQIVEIIRRGQKELVNDGDYGSVPTFYVDVHVGKWDKPHQTFPENRRLVVWKDEGGSGPITLYEPDARPPFENGHFVFPLREYGSPEPSGVKTFQGWLTKAAAEVFAKGLHADFVEA